MKKTILTALIAVLTTLIAFAGDRVRNIMEKVDARDDGASVISTMQMNLIDKNGKNAFVNCVLFLKILTLALSIKLFFSYPLAM